MAFSGCNLLQEIEFTDNKHIWVDIDDYIYNKSPYLFPLAITERDMNKWLNKMKPHEARSVTGI